MYTHAHSRTHVTHSAMLSSAPGFPGNGLCFFFFFSPSHWFYYNKPDSSRLPKRISKTGRIKTSFIKYVGILAVGVSNGLLWLESSTNHFLFSFNVISTLTQECWWKWGTLKCFFFFFLAWSSLLLELCLHHLIIWFHMVVSSLIVILTTV